MINIWEQLLGGKETESFTTGLQTGSPQAKPIQWLFSL